MSAVYRATTARAHMLKLRGKDGAPEAAHSARGLQSVAGASPQPEGGRLSAVYHATTACAHMLKLRGKDGAPEAAHSARGAQSVAVTSTQPEGGRLSAVYHATTACAHFPRLRGKLHLAARVQMGRFTLREVRSLLPAHRLSLRELA